jgi:hypothetical protein
LIKVFFIQNKRLGLKGVVITQEYLFDWAKEKRFGSLSADNWHGGMRICRDTAF